MPSLVLFSKSGLFSFVSFVACAVAFLVALLLVAGDSLVFLEY